MKFSLVVSATSLAATLWIGEGQSVSGVSLETPAVPTENSTCSDWAAWMPPRTEPAVILQAVSEGYLPVEKNFIAQLEANTGFSRDNIYIMCLDEESEKATKRMGIRCVPVANQWDHENNSLWKLRVKVLACLLQAGQSTILSDSDALWLKDPAHDFDLPEVRDSSIVASRGPFPPIIESMWGSALCMGFIFFRAGAGVNMIMDNVARLVMVIGDDQLALNYVLYEMGIKWDTRTDMRYVFSTEFGRGTVARPGEGGVNVTLLPHSKYTRDCDEMPIGSNTTVAHCIAEKVGTSKISWMKEEKLWFDDPLEDAGQSKIKVVSTPEEDWGG